MSSIIQNFNYYCALIIFFIWLFSVQKKEIIKRKENKGGFIFFILIHLIMIISGGLLFFFPKVIMPTWLILSFTFPLFLLKNNWNNTSRILYNFLLGYLLFSSLFSLFGFYYFKKDFMEYIGVNYQIETLYSIDRDGDESSTDYFYSLSGNKNLDNVLNNYLVVIYSVIISFVTCNVMYFDRKLRTRILEQDKLDLEKQKKEQDYLDE
jgi:hypothetical protein